MSARASSHENSFAIAVFSAPLLRALDARGRADVWLSSRVHELAAGALLFSAGTPADALFVVARGKLSLDAALDPRMADEGVVFGWDAAVPGGVRSGRAVATEASAVVELPLGALRRGLTRSGAEQHLAREERRARRKAWRRLMAETELGSALDVRALDRLVDSSREQALAPGETLGASERPAEVAWLVLSGLVALPEGGYATRGHFVGLQAAVAGGAHSGAERALGDALSLAVPVALLEELRRRYPEAMERELLASRRRGERQLRALGRGHGSVPGGAPFGRLESAGSLLAIDVGACVDCGHCVVACADTHGTPRFARHGERVVASVDGAAGLEERAFLLPNACQHCKDPACLPECPTGALVRDARGAVTLRTELCTGCGACVSACPWDAVKLAPTSASSAVAAFATAVAVKCDLCSGRDGPECVLACPTGAIARFEPARDFAELRVVLGGARRPGSALPVPGGLGPWLARAAVLPPLAVALALSDRAGSSTRFGAGLLSGLILVALFSHAVVKRVPAARSATGRLLRLLFGQRASLLPLVRLHVVLGVLSVAAVLVHAGPRLGAGVAGFLALSYWLLVVTGALGGAAYLVVPARLARLEPVEPAGDGGAPDALELDRRLFAALSGANDAVRVVARRFLIPHARSRLGALGLLCSMRDTTAEERALLARIGARLGGRKSARLAGLDALIRATVAIRVARAARVGRALLGAFVPLHVMLSALLLGLLVIHVVGAFR